MSNQHRTENWWVSPFNFVPEVREEVGTLPKSVKLHDATLRDGEQTPGVVFRREEKVEIARLLDEVGVQRIEVALPVVSQEDVEATKAVAALGLKADTYVLCRATEKDIDLAAECGVDGIILEMPVGVPRLQYQFPSWTEDTVIERALSGLTLAEERNLKTTIFPMDLSRATPEFVDRYFAAIAAHDVQPQSIAVVDTTGSMIPEACAYLVRKIRDTVGCEAEIHTHNDFQLGVGAPLASVAAGASVVHCSVGGIGERTGNTALEEVVVALEVLYGVDTGIDVGKLTALNRRVMEIAGFAQAVSKPIVGSRTFTRESGMGLNLIKEEPLALFALRPGFVGQEPGYVLGKKSGLASVQMKIADLGLDPVDDETAGRMLQAVKARGMDKKDLVTDEEFAEIYRSATGG